MTNTQTSTDSMGRALAGIRQAEAEGREISDSTARIIVSMFKVHNRKAKTNRVKALADTGTLIYGEVTNTWRDLFPHYNMMSRNARLCADWLGTYMQSRALNGKFSAVWC